MSDITNQEFDFTLVLTGIDAVSDSEVNALYEAGCDDATVSIRSDRVYITFSRTASSLKDAILSAIGDVSSANIGAEVLRIDSSNLITQAEIARRSDRSRQVINQYILGTRGPGGFPPPLCNISDDAPLWSWCEVSYWLWENNMVKEDVVREAEQLDVINSVLELRHQRKSKPVLAEEIIQLLK